MVIEVEGFVGVGQRGTDPSIVLSVLRALLHISGPTRPQESTSGIQSVFAAGIAGRQEEGLLRLGRIDQFGIGVVIRTQQHQGAEQVDTPSQPSRRHQARTGFQGQLQGLQTLPETALTKGLARDLEVLHCIGLRLRPSLCHQFIDGHLHASHRRQHVTSTPSEGRGKAHPAGIEQTIDGVHQRTHHHLQRFEGADQSQGSVRQAPPHSAHHRSGPIGSHPRTGRITQIIHPGYRSLAQATEIPRSAHQNTTSSQSGGRAVEYLNTAPIPCFVAILFAYLRSTHLNI